MGDNIPTPENFEDNSIVQKNTKNLSKKNAKSSLDFKAMSGAYPISAVVNSNSLTLNLSDTIINSLSWPNGFTITVKDIANVTKSVTWNISSVTGSQIIFTNTSGISVYYTDSVELSYSVPGSNPVNTSSGLLSNFDINTSNTSSPIQIINNSIIDEIQCVNAHYSADGTKVFLNFTTPHPGLVIGNLTNLKNALHLHWTIGGGMPNTAIPSTITISPYVENQLILTFSSPTIDNTFTISYDGGLLYTDFTDASSGTFTTAFSNKPLSAKELVITGASLTYASSTYNVNLTLSENINYSSTLPYTGFEIYIDGIKMPYWAFTPSYSINQIQLVLNQNRLIRAGSTLTLFYNKSLSDSVSAYADSSVRLQTLESPISISTTTYGTSYTIPQYAYLQNDKQTIEVIFSDLLSYSGSGAIQGFAVYEYGTDSPISISSTSLNSYPNNDIVTLTLSSLNTGQILYVTYTQPGGSNNLYTGYLGNPLHNFNKDYNNNPICVCFNDHLNGIVSADGTQVTLYSNEISHSSIITGSPFAVYISGSPATYTVPTTIEWANQITLNIVGSPIKASDTITVSYSAPNYYLGLIDERSGMSIQNGSFNMSNLSTVSLLNFSSATTDSAGTSISIYLSTPNPPISKSGTGNPQFTIYKNGSPISVLSYVISNSPAKITASVAALSPSDTLTLSYNHASPYIQDSSSPVQQLQSFTAAPIANVIAPLMASAASSVDGTYIVLTFSDNVTLDNPAGSVQGFTLTVDGVDKTSTISSITKLVDTTKYQFNLSSPIYAQSHLIQLTYNATNSNKTKDIHNSVYLSSSTISVTNSSTSNNLTFNYASITPDGNYIDVVLNTSNTPLSIINPSIINWVIKHGSGFSTTVTPTAQIIKGTTGLDAKTVRLTIPTQSINLTDNYKVTYNSSYGPPNTSNIQDSLGNLLNPSSVNNQKVYNLLNYCASDFVASDNPTSLTYSTIVFTLVNNISSTSGIGVTVNSSPVTPTSVTLSPNSHTLTIQLPILLNDSDVVAIQYTLDSTTDAYVGTTNGFPPYTASFPVINRSRVNSITVNTSSTTSSADGNYIYVHLNSNSSAPNLTAIGTLASCWSVQETVGGSPSSIGVSSATLQGTNNSVVKLTLASSLTPGSTIQATYTDLNSGGRIHDAQTDPGPFSGSPTSPGYGFLTTQTFAVNNAAAPILNTAIVQSSGTQIILTFDADVSPTSPNGFTVNYTPQGGSPTTLNYTIDQTGVALNQYYINITDITNPIIYYKDSVTIGYTIPGTSQVVSAESGTQMATLVTPLSAINSSLQSHLIFDNAYTSNDGSQVLVILNSPVGTTVTGTDLNTAWQVKQGTNVFNVSSVIQYSGDSSGKTIQLNLVSNLVAGGTVTVSYLDSYYVSNPTNPQGTNSNSITNSQTPANKLFAFTNQSVVNNTYPTLSNVVVQNDGRYIHVTLSDFNNVTPNNPDGFTVNINSYVMSGTFGRSTTSVTILTTSVSHPSPDVYVIDLGTPTIYPSDIVTLDYAIGTYPIEDIDSSRQLQGFTGYVAENNSELDRFYVAFAHTGFDNNNYVSESSVDIQFFTEYPGIIPSSGPINGFTLKDNQSNVIATTATYKTSNGNFSSIELSVTSGVLSQSDYYVSYDPTGFTPITNSNSTALHGGTFTDIQVFNNIATSSCAIDGKTITLTYMPDINTVSGLDPDGLYVNVITDSGVTSLDSTQYTLSKASNVYTISLTSYQVDNTKLLYIQYDRPSSGTNYFKGDQHGSNIYTGRELNVDFPPFTYPSCKIQTLNNSLNPIPFINSASTTDDGLYIYVSVYNNYYNLYPHTIGANVEGFFVLENGLPFDISSAKVDSFHSIGLYTQAMTIKLTCVNPTSYNKVYTLGYDSYIGNSHGDNIYNNNVPVNYLPNYDFNVSITNNTSSSNPPYIKTASLQSDGETIIVTMSEYVLPSSPLGFSVVVDGNNVVINSISYSTLNDTYTLSLNVLQPITRNQIVELIYTSASTTSYIYKGSSPAPPYYYLQPTTVFVENNGPVNTAPIFFDAYTSIDGSQIFINFAEVYAPPLTSSSSLNGFGVTVNGSSATITSQTINAPTQILLTLNSSVVHGDEIVVTYNPGNLTDSFIPANSVASFTQPVLNLVSYYNDIFFDPVVWAGLNINPALGDLYENRIGYPVAQVSLDTTPPLGDIIINENPGSGGMQVHHFAVYTDTTPTIPSVTEQLLFNTQYYAFQFASPGVETLASISVKLSISSLASNGSEYIEMYLYSDDFNTVGSRISTSSNQLLFSTLTPSSTEYAFTFTDTLKSNTNYWVVMALSNMPIGNNNPVIILGGHALETGVTAQSEDIINWVYNTGDIPVYLITTSTKTIAEGTIELEDPFGVAIRKAQYFGDATNPGEYELLGINDYRSLTYYFNNPADKISFIEVGVTANKPKNYIIEAKINASDDWSSLFTIIANSATTDYYTYTFSAALSLYAVRMRYKGDYYASNTSAKLSIAATDKLSGVVAAKFSRYSDFRDATDFPGADSSGWVQIEDGLSEFDWNLINSNQTWKLQGASVSGQIKKMIQFGAGIVIATSNKLYLYKTNGNITNTYTVPSANIVINALTIHQNNLYVGLSNGVVLSSNSGANYTTLFTIPNALSIISLTSYNSALFIGTGPNSSGKSSLYYYTNNILSLNRTFNQPYIYALASVGNYLYVALGGVTGLNAGAIYQFDNIQWTLTLTSNTDAVYTLLHATANGKLYAGLSNGYIMQLSFSNGKPQSWSKSYVSDANVFYAMEDDPSGNYFWSATDTGLIGYVANSNTYYPIDSPSIVSGGLMSTWTNSDASNYQYVGIGANQIIVEDGPINWDNTFPSGVNSSYINTVWEGYIQTSTSENYTFYLDISDGARLYIGGELIIDAWKNNSSITEYTGIATMVSGQWTSIRIEYYLGSESHPGIKLYWSSNTISKELVPSTSLGLPNNVRDLAYIGARLFAGIADGNLYILDPSQIGQTERYAYALFKDAAGNVTPLPGYSDDIVQDSPTINGVKISNGTIYQVHADKSTAAIFSSSVSSALYAPDRLIEQQAIYESQPFYAPTLTTWSNISTLAQYPVGATVGNGLMQGTGIKIYVRTGNTRAQCLSADWGSPFDINNITDTISGGTGYITNTFNIATLSGKWLQYKLVMSSASQNFAPIIKNVTLTYSSANASYFFSALFDTSIYSSDISAPQIRRGLLAADYITNGGQVVFGYITDPTAGNTFDFTQYNIITPNTVFELPEASQYIRFAILLVSVGTNPAIVYDWAVMLDDGPVDMNIMDYLYNH